MAVPQSYASSAYNPVPESENRIHSDEIAQRFGFQGGLVPGVVVSAYLLAGNRGLGLRLALARSRRGRGREAALRWRAMMPFHRVGGPGRDQQVHRQKEN